MLQMTYPWWEIVLRAIGIYIAVFFLFRVIGKKQLGEMSPFDFVLLLIVSEAVSGGLVGEEYSILGGLISATTLVAVSYIIDYFAFKSKKFEKFIEGEPQFVIKNGEICDGILEKAKITISELKEALRQQGIESIRMTKYAVLETNGKITAIKWEKK